jgi:pimeloyl-ACP methyl ester carboxylesterase
VLVAVPSRMFRKTCLIALGLLLALASSADGRSRRRDRRRAQRTNLKYPVILLHGFNASPAGKTGFSNEVRAALMRGTVNVVAPQLNPFASTKERGQQIIAAIDKVKKAFGVDKVHLVGHSQGGLDARWVASPKGGKMGSSVASIVTLSTPHRGTPMADIALKALQGPGKVRGLLRKTVCKLLALRLSRSARDFKWDAEGALRDMAIKNDLASQLPNAPGVTYYSVGAQVDDLAPPRQEQTRTDRRDLVGAGADAGQERRQRRHRPDPERQMGQIPWELPGRPLRDHRAGLEGRA